MTNSSIKRLVKHDSWPAWAKTGWHYFMVYLKDVNRTDLLSQASSMAYTTLFSLVPSLAAVFTLLGLFLPILGNHSNLLDEARQFLFKNLATGSGSQVVDYLEKFIAGLNLKRIGMVAFVGLLVTLVLLLRQIETALNRIWLVHEARPVLTRFIYFWLFLTLGMFGLSVVIGLSTSYSVTTLITKKAMAVADSADDIPILSMAFSWLVGCVLFFLIYKIVPNCNVENKPAARGALLAGTLFYLLGKLYTVYVSSFANYKSVYGTLAALPIFLMWIYVCWLVALAGALFAWRWQTGFPDIRDNTTIETATTSIEHLRNHRIRTKLPLLALLVIYHRFEEGTGKGISTSELVSKLHLPHAWIYEAVDILKDLGLVLQGRTTTMMHSSETEMERWFPTQPADKVQLATFADALNGPVDHWHQSWDPQIPVKLRRVMVGDELTSKTQTVADVIEKLGPQRG